jgi:hypothetical protein
LLGESGVIRIGGNTSERTVWRAAGEPAAAESLVITPVSVDRLAAALRILGWKLIYGLNLARGAPEAAAEEAAYVARAVGSNLLAFQIGNEPDGFGRWTAVRPKTYDAAAYLSEWHAFHAAVRARPRRALRRTRRRRRHRLGRRIRRGASRGSRAADAALLCRRSGRRAARDAGAIAPFARPARARAATARAIRPRLSPAVADR